MDSLLVDHKCKQNSSLEKPSGLHSVLLCFIHSLQHPAKMFTGLEGWFDKSNCTSHWELCFSLLHCGSIWEFPGTGDDEEREVVITAQLKGHLEDFTCLRPQQFDPPLKPLGHLYLASDPDDKV